MPTGAAHHPAICRYLGRHGFTAANAMLLTVTAGVRAYNGRLSVRPGG